MPETLQVSPFTANVFRRRVPDRLSTPVQAARPSTLNSQLGRIFRQQAVGNWMLPSLSLVTPQYIEMILRGALGGNHVQMWELFDLMEDTWPRLLKNLGELKGAVAQMDWKLEAWADDDQPPTATALERKKLICDAAWRMQPAADQDDNGFEQTIADILDAWAKGTSVLEIIWETRRVGQLGELTVPNCTTWVHPRNYAWSGECFLGLNPNAQSDPNVHPQQASYVEQFPEHKFLIAIAKAKSGPPMTSALLRPLAWWWCAANFSADWLMNLAQLFGIPFRWATFAQNASDETVATIGNLLANMGSNGYGAFPEGTNLNFLEGGKNAGQSPQADLMERADKNCDLLILGQTLTSDTGGSGAGGGSLALGRVHEGVKSQIVQSAANFVARVLNQQLIPAILKENYGDADEAPYFCPEPETVEDEKANADRDKVLIDAGVEMPKKWFYERHSIPLPQAGEEVIERVVAPPPNGAPVSDPAGSEADPKALQASRAAKPTPEERLRTALAEKVDPVLALLNRIAAIDDDAVMLKAFQQFLAEGDTLKALVTADVRRTAAALGHIQGKS